MTRRLLQLNAYKNSNLWIDKIFCVFVLFVCRRALKLLIILSTMAFVTLALLQYQQKLKRPARARWRTVMESSSECVAPVKELGCAVPAFTAEWSTVPSLDIQIYSAHIDDRLVVDGEIQNFIRIIGRRFISLLTFSSSAYDGSYIYIYL